MQTKEEFYTKLSKFCERSIDATVKLNFASFYTPDTAPRDSPESVESIIAKALSTHVHYQFSYLPLIVQIVDSFTQVKIPFSVLDKSKRPTSRQKEDTVAASSVVSTAGQAPYKFRLQFYAFLNDVYVLISDLQPSVKEGSTPEAGEDVPPIQNVYDGFVAKIQAYGFKGSVVFSNEKKEERSSLFENSEGVIEKLYVGGLSNEMLEFLWSCHLDGPEHKERLLSFYTFFNFDLAAVVPSPYFSIFPELCESAGLSAERGGNDEDLGPIEENFSQEEIYAKIPEMCYQQNKEIDVDFINARNSKILEPENVAEVEHFFSMKTIQVLFTKHIVEKIIRHLSQSLDVQKYRKGNRPRLSRQAEQAIANSPIKTIGKLTLPKKQGTTQPKPKQRTVPAVAPVTELQIVISIDSPQINVQNELKKSQAIITTGERICMLVYNTYIREQKEEYWIQKTGWAFIPSLKCYIAPTNLYKEEKTMWLSFQQDQQVLAKRNLMEIIMLARNNEVTINVMNPEFYDLVKPMLTLDIKATHMP
ncbi:MAG: hypothetical protein P4M11_13015 [Candidatus Pacebacteria bacterium]|nr:hypothetical protein [Candidatus Paceibacterota bacterium]